MDFRLKLLNYYGLSETDFKELTKPLNELSLPDFDKVPDMEKIKTRIFKAISNEEKIIIYGDYDCDGVCSTSIMVKTFEKLNYPVSYYIPSRYLDGYGLNEENVKKISDAGFKLIITVDNGICQNEAICLANELGMDVIVIDHHELPEMPVNALGIVHPIVSNISDVYGCGGLMSLITSAGLLGYYDEYLVTLAGLATISDMMELKKFNRNVVRLALDNLKRNKYLALTSLIDSPLINETTFGMEIAPKLNAIARIVENKNVNNLVKFLITENRDDIFKLSAWIKNTNELRKTLTNEAIDALPSELLDQPGIVLNLDIKEGLMGLIANRLLAKYNVPIIILSKDSKDENFLKGSIRSKEGFNVQKAFESLSKYLVAGGGHALAGGLTIKKSDFEDFKRDFIELAKEHKITAVEPPSIEINLQDISVSNYEILREFAPFGQGFKEPVFVVRDLPTKKLQFIKNGSIISTPISINSKILGFNVSESQVKSHLNVDLFGNLVGSYFRDKFSVELRVSDFITKN